MSNDTTKPEEKGFFEKVKETIENLWDGTKDTAEDDSGAEPCPFSARWPHHWRSFPDDEDTKQLHDGETCT